MTEVAEIFRLIWIWLQVPRRCVCMKFAVRFKFYFVWDGDVFDLRHCALRLKWCHKSHWARAEHGGPSTQRLKHRRFAAALKVLVPIPIPNVRPWHPWPQNQVLMMGKSNEKVVIPTANVDSSVTVYAGTYRVLSSRIRTKAQTAVGQEWFSTPLYQRKGTGPSPAAMS